MQETSNGTTALMRGSQKGYIWSGEGVIAARGGCERQELMAITVLMQAPRRDRSEVMRMLLSAGAEVNARLDNGATALMLASQIGHKGVAQALSRARLT